MVDFTQTATVKTAVRELASTEVSMTPLILTRAICRTNRGAVGPMKMPEQPSPAISKSSESHSGRVIYKNIKAKTVGSISIKAPTPSAYH